MLLSRTLMLGSLLLLLSMAFSSAPPHTSARPPATGAPPAGNTPRAGDTRPAVHGETTLEDQVDVGLTVYNSNIALVRDVRDLQLPTAVSDLRFEDVAATVNPATVHLRSLSEPGQLGVLEQNYEYDLLEPDKLLRKYVGRSVTLVRTRQEDGSTVREEVPALLVSYNNGPIWKVGNEFVTGLGADHYRFPELPENLYSRPTLVWKLENRGAGRQRIEASYLAQSLSWSADYVLTVARDDKVADLDGWVTLTNGSGTLFRNAKLQLVAGDLNRVRPATPQAQFGVAGKMARAEEARSMVQEAFSEYHLYTLDRRTTIANNETKQVSMLSGSGVPIEKRYAVFGQQFYYRNVRQPGSPLRDDVQVFYRFRNDEKSRLGLPLPAGVVRVYQADSKGGVQFAGEDRIDHTPKDETLDLKIGNAFDVVCERKQIDFEKIAGSVYEVEFEITLRNHKSAPISVDVNEPIGGTWRMLNASHKWEKSEAWAARFVVPVASDGTSVLKYRVRVEY